MESYKAQNILIIILFRGFYQSEVKEDDFHKWMGLQGSTKGDSHGEEVSLNNQFYYNTLSSNSFPLVLKSAGPSQRQFELWTLSMCNIYFFKKLDIKNLD